MRTFRRTYLDAALEAQRSALAGDVLDVGGKRAQKRGRFRPEISAGGSWRYLNVDPVTEPDFLASADAMPVPNASFDAVLMTEVLEHLSDPGAVLAEVRRVLRPGGRVVATMPFLFPVHGDPEDYQRWTPERIRAEFEGAGLGVDSVEPMGSAAAVMFDLAWITWNAYLEGRPVPVRRAAAFPFLVLKPLVQVLDGRMGRVRSRITTGWLILGGHRG